jgi:glycosyltransferase involved in cell wall biosynthesis
MYILNMIVKNESKIIERCLDSIKDFIDALVISDTGSTDNTISIIEKWKSQHNKQGQVVSHQWKNFGHNRNLALTACIEWIHTHLPDDDHYIIFMDADDYIIIDDKQQIHQQLSNLTEDNYVVNITDGNIIYERVFSIKAPKINQQLLCRWEGVLHEYLDREGTSGKLDGIHIKSKREGARSQDPMKYLKDALMLETALKEEPNNARYVFYLAQSYRDCDTPLFKKMAEKTYLKRYEMGGWDEEMYVSLVEAARCRIDLDKNDAKTLDILTKAYNFRPTRLEAPYYIVQHYRLTDKHIMGYTFGKSLVSLPYPDDILFVDTKIHKWKFYDELAVCAAWAQDKQLFRELCERILALPNISQHDYDRISNDLKTFG